MEFNFIREKEALGTWRFESENSIWPMTIYSLRNKQRKSNIPRLLRIPSSPVNLDIRNGKRLGNIKLAIASAILNCRVLLINRGRFNGSLSMNRGWHDD